ncbi:MAG: DUF4271 domain-containing protein [Salibacteraceae bacterium]
MKQSIFILSGGVGDVLSIDDLTTYFVFREVDSSGWIFGLILLQIVIFAWLRLIYPSRSTLLFNAFISNRFVNQLNREEESSHGIYNLAIEINYFISFSLFIYLINEKLNLMLVNTEGILRFLALGLAVILFVLVKNLMVRIMVWILDLEESFTDVFFYRFLGHAALSVILIPLVVLSVYLPIDSDIWIKIGAVILSLAFVYRLGRSTLRFWTVNSFSLKYIILYICALEILPISIFLKVLLK